MNPDAQNRTNGPNWPVADAELSFPLVGVGAPKRGNGRRQSLRQGHIGARRSEDRSAHFFGGRTAPDALEDQARDGRP